MSHSRTVRVDSDGVIVIQDSSVPTVEIRNTDEDDDTEVKEI